MRSLPWIASHVAAMASLQLLAWFTGTSSWLLYGIPLTIGVVQWAFLSGHLQWWGLFWLPACLMGVSLSFLASWWFVCALGAGIGLAQAPILAVSGFRRWWVWVLASGFGWFIGIALGSGAQDVLGAMLVTDAARMTVLYAFTTLAYGGLTAAALHVMPYTKAVPSSGEINPQR